MLLYSRCGSWPSRNTCARSISFCREWVITTFPLREYRKSTVIPNRSSGCTRTSRTAGQTSNRVECRWLSLLKSIVVLTSMCVHLAPENFCYHPPQQLDNPYFLLLPPRLGSHPLQRLHILLHVTHRPQDPRKPELHRSLSRRYAPCLLPHSA